MNTEAYEKLQALIIAAEKYREATWLSTGKSNWEIAVRLDTAIRECKEVDWFTQNDATEIPGSMYSPWTDTTINSETHLIDSISATDLPIANLSPDQIKRLEEISSTSVVVPASILAGIGGPGFSTSLAEILNDLAANSERLPADFEKVWADNIEDLYEE